MESMLLKIKVKERFLSCRKILRKCFLVEEKGHETKKEAHKENINDKGVLGQIGDTIANAYHYVSEKVSGQLLLWEEKRKKLFVRFSEVTSGASYEANKEKAKDSDHNIGERIGAGFSAVGDKVEEKTHGTKAEAYKQSI